MASPGLLSALQQGMPIETYYNNIRNFIANAPNASPQELVAAAQEWGISGEDIMRATGESPLSTYSPDSNPSNFALAQALDAIPTTISVNNFQYNPQTRDVDQGLAAQSDFNVMNPRTGQMENVTPASEFIPGASANQFVVSSGQGVFEQDGKSYQPVNLVTVDQSGNVSPSGTFNIEKNELSDFAQIVGGATKAAAIALGGYAIGSSLLNAAGLGGTAAGTAAASADAAFVAADAAQLAAQGLSQGQIAQTLVAAGVNGSTAATAAGLAASGAGASTIAGSLTGGNLFTATAADLAAAGITTGGTGTTFAGGAAAGGSTAGGAATTGGATTGGAAAGGGGTGLTAGGGTAGGAAGGVAGGTGLTAGADAAATLGTGGAATGGLAGGVAGGTGLTAGAGGTGLAAATTGGLLGSTGLVTGNTAVDLATGALTGANAAGGALSLDSLRNLFPTGLGDLTNLLSGAGSNIANALTGQANAAAAANAASTAAKLGAAAPMISALVSGGLTQDTINSLKSLGSQAQTDYRNLATDVTKDINFTPYGVTTGLFGSKYDPTTRTVESTYQPGVFEVVNAAGRSALGSFNEAAEADLGKLTADRMALYQSLVAPEQQRSRLAQEARLQAQGRLGVGAGGGEYAPELKALEDAIAKQNLQFALAAPQEALAQRGALITQGQAASQVPIQLQQQQLAQLQLGGQLGQQQAQTAAARGGLFGQYAGQGISENVLAQIAAAQVASERNKALGTALGGLFV